jgi:hypothetical protein
MGAPVIAVFDIGKTHANLLLADASSGALFLGVLTALQPGTAVHAAAGRGGAQGRLMPAGLPLTNPPASSHQ